MNEKQCEEERKTETIMFVGLRLNNSNDLRNFYFPTFALNLSCCAAFNYFTISPYLYVAASALPQQLCETNTRRDLTGPELKKQLTHTTPAADKTAVKRDEEKGIQRLRNDELALL